jgi:hypothetical protein
MKNQIFKSSFIVVLYLIVTSSMIYADKQLVISPYKQWGTKTCWAAVSIMILNAYGISQTDEKLVRCWAYPYPNQSNCDCTINGQTDLTNNLYGTSNSVEKILLQFGPISGKKDYPLAQEEISNEEIDKGRPFICGLNNANGSKHMVLAIGYRGSGGANVTKVIYNNPSSGNKEEMNYADFMVNNSFLWLETFRLTTNPRKPIPVGFYDWCWISDGGTTTITPSTTSLSYTAGFGSASTPPAHPSLWIWKLIFVNSVGDYVVAQSWTSNSTTTPVTWNISNFSLPTGYQWYYNYDGKIPGRMELELVDSDGAHHFDAIDVLYVPNSPYSGIIVYENQTVSSALPEVKAHQLIIPQNDQFLSGGNITLKAGESIDIKDGITIQNGSTTNFVVDPSVR